MKMAKKLRRLILLKVFRIFKWTSKQTDAHRLAMTTGTLVLTIMLLVSGVFVLRVLGGLALFTIVMFWSWFQGMFRRKQR